MFVLPFALFVFTARGIHVKENDRNDRKRKKEVYRFWFDRKAVSGVCLLTSRLPGTWQQNGKFHRIAGTKKPFD